MAEVYLTIPEVGRRMRVGRSTAYRRVAEGWFDLTNVGTKRNPRMVVAESAFERGMAKHTRPARKAAA